MSEIEEYKQLRIEFNRVLFKKDLAEKLGKECCNCGSCVDVQYHHIVPLRAGGSNRLSNIVPLCYVCHQIVHESKNIRRVYASKNTGRKRKQPPANYKTILDEYMTGKIGRKECHRKLELAKATKITDTWFFKEYLKENNIKEYKNRVDMLHTKKCKEQNHKGEMLAMVLYHDGTTRISYVQ